MLRFINANSENPDNSLYSASIRPGNNSVTSENIIRNEIFLGSILDNFLLNESIGKGSQ